MYFTFSSVCLVFAVFALCLPCVCCVCLVFALCLPCVCCVCLVFAFFNTVSANIITSIGILIIGIAISVKTIASHSPRPRDFATRLYIFPMSLQTGLSNLKIGRFNLDNTLSVAPTASVIANANRSPIDLLTSKFIVHIIPNSFLNTLPLPTFIL